MSGTATATTFHRGQPVRWRAKGLRWQTGWYVQHDPRGWHVVEVANGSQFTLADVHFEVEPVRLV